MKAKCKNCKFWEPPQKRVDGKLRGGIAECIDNGDYDFDVETWFQVTPNFGCNQFEAKGATDAN